MAGNNCEEKPRRSQMDAFRRMLFGYFHFVGKKAKRYLRYADYKLLDKKDNSSAELSPNSEYKYGYFLRSLLAFFSMGWYTKEKVLEGNFYAFFDPLRK